ncbi:retropepsin-like aspartic peptidase RloA3 [Pseudomonas paeninsulae]|uniref:retropepsin-like aspartic peptidase RloA3 n=1 Tax=Pseudomonas paeninsulae TaxID=3110772 RepID=UPI002D79C04D|nr:ATP-dependent zinc protease [Pseudomonas sp. IT1137]
MINKKLSPIRLSGGLVQAAILLSLCAAPAFAESQQVLGWVEEGVILPENVAVKFKLDTGALTSSMHAEDVERFKKDGDDWVRFNIELEDIDTNKQVNSQLERKVERAIKVRGAGGAERRPVVLMKVCLGDRVYEEQFSLNDRDRMNYPVLVGRRTLEKVGLVDSNKTFTVEPDCSKSASSA